MIRTISPERREELLALLEDGPKACGELARWLTISPASVKKYLGVLEQRREVKRLGGRTSGTRWALANYQPPAPVEPDVVDDVEPDLTIVGDELVDELDVQPLRPVKPPKKTPALRQATKATETVSSELPWWALAPRDGFTAIAAQHSERMRSSKEARQVPWRVIA